MADIEISSEVKGRFRVLLRNFIQSGREVREFIQKLSILTSCWEINGNMNTEHKARGLKENRKKRR